MPCDVGREGELEAVFQQIRETWGSLDIALHSIAFAPKEDLQGRLLDSSGEGFKVAMDISCHSFIRMARLAEPLMTEGGTLLAMSYHGANKVVPNYNLMGPVKAALESAVRYLAYELGDKHIRVHAVSPGPLKTRAASGLKDFDVLLSEAIERAPIGELVDIDDVGPDGRLPDDAVRPAAHRDDDLCRWRAQHHGVRLARREPCVTWIHETVTVWSLRCCMVANVLGRVAGRPPDGNRADDLPSFPLCRTDVA